jgi:hypothetical protein
MIRQMNESLLVEGDDVRVSMFCVREGKFYVSRFKLDKKIYCTHME